MSTRTVASLRLLERELARIRIADPERFPLVRLGTDYGGWTVPRRHLVAGARCVCAGAGEDISFDVALVHTYGCRVVTVDPTPRAIAHFRRLARRTAAGQPMPIDAGRTAVYRVTWASLARLRYLPVGLAGRDATLRFYAPRDRRHVSHSVLNLQRTRRYFEAPCLSLASLLRRVGWDRLDLLKLDIEGAEYAVLDGLGAGGAWPTVLCVEFDEGHSPLGPGAADRIRRRLRALVDAGYLLVSVAGWNLTFARP